MVSISEGAAGPLPPEKFSVRSLYDQSVRSFLGPVWALIEDETVSEVMINGHSEIYCERSGKVELTDCQFQTPQHLMAAARNISDFVGRPFDADHPSTDARLPDGSRVHLLMPPASRAGVCITIRKFKKASFGIEQLIKWGSLSELAADFIRLAVRAHKNIVVAGGTGTGKTSLLNALSEAIDPSERIIVIEDSSELQLAQPHVVYLETQPPRPNGHGAMSIRDLFVASLRMRPDRIVVGEVRRGEALDLVQSMLSGHAGSLSTVHASTPRDALTRLETLCMMSDVVLPVYVARTQVASAVDLVVQLARFGDGSRKVCAIAEVLPLGSEQEYRFRDLFELRRLGEARELVWTGEPSECLSPANNVDLDYDSIPSNVRELCATE